MRRAGFKKRRKAKNAGMRRGDAVYRLVVFLMACALVVALMLAAEKRFAPIVEAAAVSRINYVCSEAVFGAISETLSSEDIRYDDLVTFSYDENKKISAMQVDTVRINRLKSAVSESVLRAVNEISPSDISIRLGTVLGNEMMIDRGPKIPVRLLPVSLVNVDITNDFRAAGINQVRHRICLDVSVDVSVILPRRLVKTRVSSRITAAETVIVGDVPSGFTYVIGDKSDTIGIINDYQMH
ncbi:MAG: sporulation protein YunB [Clostridia bacterium]|nr:sporulation protein YunB [Clostridia bacterium]